MIPEYSPLIAALVIFVRIERFVVTTAADVPTCLIIILDVPCEFTIRHDVSRSSTHLHAEHRRRLVVPKVSRGKSERIVVVVDGLDVMWTINSFESCPVGLP